MDKKENPYPNGGHLYHESGKRENNQVRKMCSMSQAVSFMEKQKISKDDGEFWTVRMGDSNFK